MKQTKKIIAALAAATMVASCAGVVASAAEAVNAVNVSYSTVAEAFTAADGTVVPAGASDTFRSNAAEALDLIRGLFRKKTEA